MSGLHEIDAFDDEPLVQTLEKYRSHCETSDKHLLIVTAFFPACDCGDDHCEDDEETQVSNVFSSLEEAAKWIEAIEDGAAIFCAPVVIDDPMFDEPSDGPVGETVN